MTTYSAPAPARHHSALVAAVLPILGMLLFAGSAVANEKPIAHDQSFGTTRTDPITIELSYTDDGIPGPYTFEITGDPTKGDLTRLGLGLYLYTPHGDRSGFDTIRWKVNDGMADSNVAKAQVEINDPPVARDQEIMADENQGQGITVDLTEDLYPAAAEISIVEEPAHGSLEKLNRKFYRYTPEPGYSGPDSFLWQAFDGYAHTEVATVTLYINAKPLAADQSFDAPAGQPIEVTLEYTDDDIPGPYTFETTIGPKHGTWIELGQGRYRYTPEDGFDGKDAAHWKVDDGSMSSNSAKVTLVVAETADMTLSPSHMQFYEAVGDSELAGTVTLSNHGGSPMRWSAEPSDAGIVLTPSAGTLEPGASIDVALNARFRADSAQILRSQVTFSSPDILGSPKYLDLLVRIAEPGSLRLGISTPTIGNDEDRARTGAWLQELGVQPIRTGIDWSAYEPVDDQFDWRSFEKRVEWMYDTDISALLMITSICPEWVPGAWAGKYCVPDDNTDFREYIVALVAKMKELSARLPNGLPITMVQFSNEWLDTAEKYPGTAEQYVEQLNIVYDEIKKHFPSILVLPGGMARFAMDGFLAGEETEKTRRIEYVLDNGRYDAVDQHLYFEYWRWASVIDALRNLALPPAKRDIPIIVSEFGGPHAVDEPRDDLYHAEMVATYIETLQQTDVAIAYYYTLVERPEYKENGKLSPYAETGLVSRDTLLPKLGYEVFRSYSWASDRDDDRSPRPLGGLLDRQP